MPVERHNVHAVQEADELETETPRELDDSRWPALVIWPKRLPNDPFWIVVVDRVEQVERLGTQIGRHAIEREALHQARVRRVRRESRHERRSRGAAQRKMAIVTIEPYPPIGQTIRFGDLMTGTS